MKAENENNNPFGELRWSDIEEWAGLKTTSRGKDYQREGRVKEIKLTPGGNILAMVQGTNEYLIEVSLEKGKLGSICTCPVRYDCKHGVATVLEYLELLKEGKGIPALSEGDPFLIRVRKRHEEARTFESIKSLREARPPLRDWLEELDKEELVEILLEFSEKSLLLGSYLRDRQDLETENIEGIIKGIYSELDFLWEEVQEYDSWSYESKTPDFSNVQARMESLLDEGHYDELIAIGKEIMDRYEGFAEYDREGDIGTEISGCMSIVFEALSESFRPAHERMLDAFELELKDEYDIISEHSFWEKEYPRKEWKNFAEILKTRLSGIKKGHFPGYSEWDRDFVVGKLALALQKAGLSEEALSLCEREAEETGRYVRLVEILLASGKKEKAKEWIYRGIRKTRKEKPGIAHQLYQTLIDSKEKEGDWLFTASLQAEEFFMAPTFSSYYKMKKAAEKAGVWQELREAIHGFLEEGKLPGTTAEKVDKTSVLPGILPETGLLDPDSFKGIEAPVLYLLIKIAIEEKDPEEVVRWYLELKKGGDAAKRYTPYIEENEIANAIYEKYPYIALDIWKKLAEELISRTKVDAYREAAIHLQKVKDTMEALGQKREWEIHLRKLREENKRKPRLLEILGTL